jgi:hypothetical protein
VTVVLKTLKPNFGSMFQKNQWLGCRRLPGSSFFAGGNWMSQANRIQLRLVLT